MVRLDNESSSLDSLKYSGNGVSHEIMASKQLIYLTFASFPCPFFSSQSKVRSMKSELPAIPVRSTITSFSADCSILLNSVAHVLLIKGNSFHSDFIPSRFHSIIPFPIPFLLSQLPNAQNSC